MLPLPVESQDELRLADWLELLAIISPDGNSSFGDLERALSRASIFGDTRGRLESKLADVSKELELRATAAGASYPFDVSGSGGLITFTGNRITSSYVFCLLLSYTGPVVSKGSTVQPTRMFEALCTEAARLFLTGRTDDAISSRFGAPRLPADYPRGFRSAVNHLCKNHLLEGVGFKQTAVISAKLRPSDQGVDIVALRPWRDGLPGKLVLFGACASGEDWSTKTRELRVDEFASEWLEEIPVSPIIRGFFVPHRIPRDRWRHESIRAGILFDRCRIAYLIAQLPGSMRSHGNPNTWINRAYKALRAA